LPVNPDDPQRKGEKRPKYQLLPERCVLKLELLSQNDGSFQSARHCSLLAYFDCEGPEQLAIAIAPIRASEMFNELFFFIILPEFHVKCRF